MFSGDTCPRHPRTLLELLSTTNEWRWYCPACDDRYNDAGVSMATGVRVKRAAQEAQ